MRRYWSRFAQIFKSRCFHFFEIVRNQLNEFVFSFGILTILSDLVKDMSEFTVRTFMLENRFILNDHRLLNFNSLNDYFLDWPFYNFLNLNYPLHDNRDFFDDLNSANSYSLVVCSLIVKNFLRVLIW